MTPVNTVYGTIPNIAPFSSLIGQVIPDGTKFGDIILDNNSGEYFSVRGIVPVATFDPNASFVIVTLATVNSQL